MGRARAGEASRGKIAAMDDDAEAGVRCFAGGAAPGVRCLAFSPVVRGVRCFAFSFLPDRSLSPQFEWEGESETPDPGRKGLDHEGESETPDPSRRGLEHEGESETPDPTDHP